MDITFVREHIKGLQDKVKKVDTPDMILHSAALGGALSLTNGSRGDIPSISDQMAILTAVVVGDKLGENARHFASCPVIRSSTRDKDGKLVMPWPTRDEIRVLMEARGLKEAEVTARAVKADTGRKDAKGKAVTREFPVMFDIAKRAQEKRAEKAGNDK